MQIQSGKLYENRTWKYLYPSLKYYGTELTQYLSSFFKLAIGIGDHNVELENKNNHLFILFDVNIPLGTDREILAYKTKFSKFLDWLKYQHYYVTDYVFDSSKHMVVIKLPHKHDISYINFIQGKYSEMYEQKDMNQYFKFLTMTNKDLEKKQNERIKLCRSVLTRDKQYLPIFLDKVNKQFGSSVTVEDFLEAELDFPPKLEEEIFNY